MSSLKSTSLKQVIPNPSSQEKSGPTTGKEKEKKKRLVTTAKQAGPGDPTQTPGTSDERRIVENPVDAARDPLQGLGTLLPLEGLRWT